MNITCKNCKSHFKGNFCYNCGQPAAAHEINFHFLWHDVQHGLLHLDKGIFFTIRELFSRPGYTIREYIQGKRVKHFKPISLVLVLAGIFGLLAHFFHIDMIGDSITVNGTDETANRFRAFLTEMSDWISGHFALVSLMQLPVYALSTFLVFRKAGYNYVEHLVLNAFLTGQRLVIRIVLFPLYYALNGTLELTRLSSLVNLITIGLTLWAFFQFFDTTSRWSVFWKTVLSFIIFTFVFFGLVGVATILFMPKELRP